MPQVADVVALSDGSVGVISESLSLGQWRVLFTAGSRTDTLADDITETLDAVTYSEGDDVTVWPHMGVIQSVGAESVTVELSRSERIEGVGHIQWEPVVTVPLWRIILDNDPRIQRDI